MRRQRFWLLFAGALALAFPLAFPLAAQDAPDAFASRARALYAQGSFTSAFQLLVQSAPESADAKTKTAAADALVEIAQTEYGIRNFKNAFEAFKEALKIRPTNQIATTMYLKMKREMNVNALTNGKGLTMEPTEIPVQTAVAPVQVPATAPAPAVGAPAPEASASQRELKDLLAKLQAAQNQLSASRSSSSRSDSQTIQQVLDLLTKVVQNQSNAAPIQVQQDPRLISTMERLGGALDRSNRVSFEPWVLGVVLVAVVLLIVVLGSFLVLLYRANRRLNPKASPFRETPLRASHGAQAVALVPGGTKPAMLESTGPDSNYWGQTNTEAQLRKGLLKMERLQGLYEELQAGSLRWETVRNNLDSLEAALKAEILNLVEQKISTGDLVSYDAVLPIIFPFLTDYEDFFRDKADNLARAALIASNQSSGSEGALATKDLIQVPARLKQVLGSADRSVITAKLARAVAKRMGLSAADRDEVFRGALVHDVGYLALDANRLQQIISRREISVADREYVKSHVIRGLEYFADQPISDTLRDAIECHHERMDGSGYPRGLLGEQIPLAARIIGASETFATLISKRSYRERFDISQAVAILKDGRGTKFDPAVVDAIGEIAEQLEVTL